MDSRPGDPANTAATARATALVQAFSVVLKNLAIYPPAHPRVATAAAAFGTTLRERCTNAEHLCLQVRAEQVLVNGELAGDPCRLPERFRDAGLRGVSFAPDCDEEELLRFAAALNRSRARNGITFASQWSPTTDSRLEPLPLVFAGVHSSTDTPQPWTGDDAVGDPANSAPGAHPHGNSRLQGLIGRLAETEAVQSRLRAIELQACDPGETEEREIDLLTAIATLLPADVSNDPDEIAAAVTQILTRVERSLSELVRKNARVKGAELLRVALDIARKYFHTDTPAQLPKAELPSGRPEDARIVADLDLLQREAAQLPDTHGFCLPRAEDLGEDSATVAQRMCGIVLHALANSDNPAIAAAALPRLQKTVPRVLCELLDLYLASDGANAIASAGSVRILEALLAAGHLELVRDRGYVDAGFLGRGFPETLGLAARVLASSPTGRKTLRDGLATLGPVLQMGGAVAAARAGVLYQPEVTTALCKIGGEIAHLLLQQALVSASPGERQALFECARTLSLPAAEVAALRAVGHVDELPRDYLQLLLTAVTRADFNGPIRAASGAVLRRAAREGTGVRTHDQILQAIENLALVPGTETEALLQELANAGRFTRLGSQSRALRRCARSTLATLRGKAPA